MLTTKAPKRKDICTILKTLYDGAENGAAVALFNANKSRKQKLSVFSKMKEKVHRNAYLNGFKKGVNTMLFRLGNDICEAMILLGCRDEYSAMFCDSRLEIKERKREEMSQDYVWIDILSDEEKVYIEFIKELELWG